MNALRLRFITAAALLLAVLLTPANIFPCAFSFPEPVFTVGGGPDKPLELFAQGRLGIVLPTYYRTYLVVAYRYLSGKPLTKPEQTAVAQAWTPNWPPPGQPSPEEVPVNKWAEARSAALGLHGVASLNIDRFRDVNGDYWQRYPNCGDDAFLTAAQTASNLMKKFGAGSEPVRDWVNAQDTVFQNCGPTEANPTKQQAAESHPHIPPSPTVQETVLKLDRQYQIAAAYFYAGDFRTATQQFEQIAGDRESQWRTWAPYLVARCYIREATLNGPSINEPHRDPSAPTFNVQQMTAAEKQLQAILKNPALAAVHPASQKLLNYVEGRLHPDQRLHDVALQLAGRTPAADIAQDLVDFNWLIRQQRIGSDGVTSQEGNDWRNDLAKRGLLDDLTDWVLTFQQQSPEALSHAAERWRATKSEAWLMAALSMAKGANPNSKPLVDAAALVPQTSPAYEMAVYQRARLLVEQDKQSDARQLLDANLPRFEKGPLSAFNLLLAQRFAVAADFRQFLEYAPRTPVEYAAPDIDCYDCPETSYGQDAAKPLPKRLEGDSAAIFDQRLPLSILAEAATGTALPSELRAHIATATWARAAIVGDASVAKAVEAPTAEAHPELRDYLKAYDAANSEDSRSFAATWTMLHFPGMQPFIQGGGFRETRFVAIDDFRDNWWCGNQFPSKVLPPNTISYGNGPPIDPATGKQAVPVSVVPLPFPSFLTAAERASAGDQIRKLSTLAAAPEYMGSIVLQWAKDHPTDQRVPEALHLVVRATRYGCSGDKAGQISKAAYDLLHTHYPASPWTKQTPYWFK